MPDPTAPDVDAALARLSEVANRIADERNIFLAALRSVRVYVQDCIENGHDRTMLGNMYGARDEIDAAIRNVTGG